jgi:hypothetical protein
MQKKLFKFNYYCNKRKKYYVVLPHRLTGMSWVYVVSTSFGQCLETNQRASVHVWRKIARDRLLQTTQCIPYQLPLHTLNSIDICAIERPPHTTGVFKFQGNIKGLKSIGVPKLTRKPLQKPQHYQSPSNRLILRLDAQ